MYSLTDAWTYLYRDIFKEDDFFFTFGGTSVILAIVFYGLCGALMVVDLTGKPAWMLQYKVQPGINQPIDKQRLWKAFKVATFNHMCISVPYMVILYTFQKYMGCSCKPEDLPSLITFIKHILGILVVEEIGFYYLHRLAHWGPFYRHIHKQHHEWTTPVGIVAVYCHPLEHITCNVLPLTLGAPLMGAHLFTTLLWYVTALSTTIIHHSGFHLPLLPSPEFHDYHHLKFSWNYGVFGILDWLHGTDKQFRQTPQFQRHKTLYGLNPLSQVYPDKRQT